MSELEQLAVPCSTILLDDGDLRDLRAGVRGDVVDVEQPEYETARRVWNGMIDRHPAVIVRCLGVSDVLAGLAFARERGLPVTVRGGGHNIAGLAVEEGAVMLDLSRMRGVLVDPANRRAIVQAGCLLGDVDRETQIHGLAAVLGFISTTGVAGLTLGGGFGYLTRRYGWTVDNVRSMEVVTADGEVVRASDDAKPDLFWALRGGGGNFGVVTSIEYDLYPIGPTIFGGAIAWRADLAPRVLSEMAALLPEVGPETVLVAFLRFAPPAPWIDPAAHGRSIIALFVCHTGDLEVGERIARRLRSIGPAVGDILQRRSYLSQQSLLDATQPKGRRNYWKSDFLPAFEPDMIEPLTRHASRMASPHSVILLFPLDGAISSVPADHTAAANRDAAMVLNVAASWESAEDDVTHVTWARDAWTELHRFSTGGSYINFQTDDEGEDRIRTAYGGNYDRLVEVKTRWDPRNLFRGNRNIQPRT